ncbi:hypothetical protein K7432_017222 [Basidiobolus ranarum]|uniref:Uncharacterized protein n=1 Tax=Basidiobolus ranarum TaxID=34480 RepID=A0ABR2VKN2_9FUNG
MDIELDQICRFSFASKAFCPSEVYNLGAKLKEASEIPVISHAFFAEQLERCHENATEFLTRCDRLYRISLEAPDMREKVRMLDYTIHTKKGDTNIYDVQKYSMRDGIQWLAMWMNHSDDDLWYTIAKIVAYATSLDDICVPYTDVEDGTYKFLDETLDEILVRVHRLGSGRDKRWLTYTRENIHFAARIQYFEKQETTGSEWFKDAVDCHYVSMYRQEPDLLRAGIYRNFDTMTAGVLSLILYYHGFEFDQINWHKFNVAALCDTLGMDLGKDALNIGRQCPTNFVHSLSNATRFTELAKLFAGLMSDLKNPLGIAEELCERFAEIALRFATKHDRYLERLSMTRVQLTPTMECDLKRAALHQGAL